MNYIETLNQMGGISRLQTMIGAYNFSKDGESVSFKFKSCEKANACVIILEPSDTYTVKFYKQSGYECPMVESFDDVYCDQLIQVFEMFTGLFLSL